PAVRVRRWSGQFLLPAGHAPHRLHPTAAPVHLLPQHRHVLLLTREGPLPWSVRRNALLKTTSERRPSGSRGLTSGFPVLPTGGRYRPPEWRHGPLVLRAAPAKSLSALCWGDSTHWICGVAL